MLISCVWLSFVGCFDIVSALLLDELQMRVPDGAPSQFFELRAPESRVSPSAETQLANDVKAAH